jgi:transmembrane sensor
MNRDSSTEAEDPAVFAQARAWVAARNSGMDARRQSELRQWLAADPAHRAAFAAADSKRSDVDWALHVGVVDEVLAGLERRARRRRRRRLAALCATAGALVVAGLIPGWRTRNTDTPAAEHAWTLAVHEARRMALPDGSEAQVREGSEIALAYSGVTRGITLRSGAAHFTVKPDRMRPFIVTSGGIEIRAVGTAFTVESTRAGVDVLVTEGRVSVEPAADGFPHSRPLIVDAGQQVAVSSPVDLPSAPLALSPDALRERLAWRIPRLEFTGTPLGEVIAAMNRHNDVQFVLGDPALGTMELSGSLRADKIEALVGMLEADFPIQAARAGDTIVLRRR